MNNYSIKIVRRTDKQNAKGENPLILQIIINSRSKKIGLKESIDPKFWDDKNSKAIGKGFKSLNVKLNKIKSDLEAHCSLKEAGGVSITFDLIDRYFKGKSDNDFYQLFDEIVEAKGLKEATAYKYSLLRKRLKSYKSNIYTSDIDSVSIKKKNVNTIVDKMSSGQRALFFIVTEIIANIRYNSFLIFDEPETHLHPNAITEFMNVIIELLHEFDSYGLIATHSPLVVREVFSDSIFVFEKDDDMPMVRKLEFETFGENLSAITNEIFGNKDTSKYYIKAIEELVNSGKSYDEIELDIKGEVPLNLNLEILIKSLIKNRDEEPK